MEEQNSSQNIQDNSTNYTKYVLIVILLVIIAGLGFYAYHKATKQAPPPSQQMQPSQTMKTQETITPSAPAETGSASSGAMQNTKQKITVTASNFTFDPKTITVKKGQPVEITFKNSGGTHDFVIDEFHVKTQIIPGGQSEIVTFIPDKTGTFNYYCSVGNHRAMGMQGTITVE